jgi:hypothetical protein
MGSVPQEKASSAGTACPSPGKRSRLGRSPAATSQVEAGDRVRAGRRPDLEDASNFGDLRSARLGLAAPAEIEDPDPFLTLAEK